MDTTLDSIKLAEDLIKFQTSFSGDVIIKRFPSPDDVVIVNPFILALNTSDQHLKMAISFNEYPASVFPKIIFQQIPFCLSHKTFPHPNVNVNTGLLELRPRLARPCVHVNHVVNFVRYITTNPLHYEGSCFSNHTEEIISHPTMPTMPTMPIMPINIPNTVPQPQERGGSPFMEHVKNVGSVFTVIKTGIEIGKIFMALIGL